MSNIRYCTPYAIDKNLAQAYNDEMSRANPGEYVAFVDRDAMFLLPDFGHTIHRIVKRNPNCFFTCLVNRTNCDWQRKAGVNTDDITHHIKYAKNILNSSGLDVEDHTYSPLWSGHLMICPKDKWEDLTTEGLLGVDNEIHLKARNNGHKVLLMSGVYMYHYYSGFDGSGGHKKRNKEHLL